MTQCIGTSMLFAAQPVQLEGREENFEDRFHVTTFATAHNISKYIYIYICVCVCVCVCVWGTVVAQWLRCCATNRKVAGSIPAGVTGIFHRHKILLIALWPWG